MVALVYPVENANVGSGVIVDVEVVIQLTDEITEGPLYGGNVTVEDQVFKQDSVDPLLWKGTLTVPKGEITFEVIVETADKTIFTKNVTYFNKSGALKPLVMGVSPGNYIMTYDPLAHRIAKINLSNFLWSDIVKDSRLAGTDILFDFNSGYQHAYTTIEGNEPSSQRIVAADIGAGGLPIVFFAGTVSHPVNITYDSSKSRVLVLTKTSTNPDKFSAIGVPIGTGKAEEPLTGGFKYGKSEADSFSPATNTVAWNIPLETTKGTFKSFAYYRNGNTFLIADERVISGVKRTIIQAFLEGADGVAKQLFEVPVGPDISNITVNNGNSAGAPGGLAYVAENKSSLIGGKLKVIDLKTGVVSDFGEIRGNTTIASYSELRIDNTNQKLYIGDVVADSVYEVNVASKVIRELPLAPAIVDQPPPVDD